MLSVKSPQFSNSPYAKCHFIDPSLTGFGLTEPAVAASIPYYEPQSRLSREGDKTDKLPPTYNGFRRRFKSAPNYSVSMIGSVPWRLANYGLSPTVKYLRERSQSKPLLTNSAAEISLEQFLRIVTKRNPVEVTKGAQLIVSSTLTELRQSYQSAFELGTAIKPVLDKNTSVSRLIVLAALLEIFEINTFIETGTQHGISASAVAKCSAENNLNLSMHSIDVGSPYLVKHESEVNYIRLKRPARKVFKKITFEIAKGKTMFFHDSDHTYENMYFEFNWAWNMLGVEILVSDDIDLNNAYSNFCSDNSLREYRIKMDSGTTIGVALRLNNGLD